MEEATPMKTIVFVTPEDPDGDTQVEIDLPDDVDVPLDMNVTTN